MTRLSLHSFFAAMLSVSMTLHAAALPEQALTRLPAAHHHLFQLSAVSVPLGASHNGILTKKSRWGWLQPLIREIRRAFHRPAEPLLRVSAGSYPDSRLKGQPPRPIETVILELANIHLRARGWEKRHAAPFNPQEEASFDHHIGVLAQADLHLEAHEVKSITHTTFDRKNQVMVRARVESFSGDIYLVEFAAGDTTSLDALKRMMDTFDQLKEPDALAQISAGNQGDVPGNFTIFPDHGRWRFYGGNNEDLSRRTLRGFVQYKNGKRRLGELHVTRNVANQQVTKVELSPENHWLPFQMKIRLSPEEVEFVMVSYTLAWADTPIDQLLKEQYTATSDLRHLFALPFLQDRRRNVFYEQLVGNDRTLANAFAKQPVQFELVNDLRQALSRPDLERDLKAQGYQSVNTISEVQKPGHYFIDGNRIFMILLPSRYPINALAMSADGERLLSINVGGQSGTVGANAWTFWKWFRQSYPGYPYVFVLDHGKDPRVILYEDGQSPLLLVADGRDQLNLAINVVSLGGPAQKESRIEGSHSIWYGRTSP